MKEYTTADHLSKEDHKKQGADYTPRDIALKMAVKFDLKESDRTDWDKFKILDPCVGKANLLLAMIETYPWLKNENLYGLDIDPVAIQYCTENFPGGHFQVGNVLEDNITDDDFWKKDPMEKYVPRPKTFVQKFGQVK